MGLDSVTYYRIDCDRCPADALTFKDKVDSEYEAEQKAKEKGFVERKSEWLCPKCAKTPKTKDLDKLKARYAMSEQELDDLMMKDPLAPGEMPHLRQNLLKRRPELRHAVEDLEAMMTQ